MKPRLESAPPTSEDFVIWRDQVCKRALRWGMFLAERADDGDRRDAELMYLRERAKATTTEAWEDWATHRREWFPSRWGLA